MTNRQNVRTRPSNDFANLLSLMLVCLVFLSLGNLVFHVRVLPITESGLQFLLAHFSVPMEVYSDVPQFFWTVIVAAQEDILFVLLIAFSCLLRVRRIFIFSVFPLVTFRNLCYNNVNLRKTEEILW